jgi:hypothetical protein
MLYVLHDKTIHFNGFFYGRKFIAIQIVNQYFNDGGNAFKSN